MNGRIHLRIIVNSLHCETKKPLWSVLIGAAFGYNNPRLLVAASSSGSQYEIVIGYVDLLPIQLGGERREAVAVSYIKY
jgi:hypothetical protein